MKLKELTKETKLKTEWSEQDFKRANSAITAHFINRPLNTREGVRKVYTHTQVVELLGLPYTSTSMCAAEWVTNTEIWEQDASFNYIGFAISESGKVVAILWDQYENEKLYQIN